jgi:hypothetical protein
VDLRLVFVSGGGSPWFNFIWSSNWPAAAAASAAAAAAAAQRRRLQWAVAAPRSALCACRAAGASARHARLSQPSHPQGGSLVIAGTMSGTGSVSPARCARRPRRCCTPRSRRVLRVDHALSDVRAAAGRHMVYCIYKRVGTGRTEVHVQCHLSTD